MIYSIDYSSGYSEGDNNPSSVVNCDLTDINNKLFNLTIIVSEILSSLRHNHDSYLLKFDNLFSVLDRIENKISSLPTADGIKVYFDNNIPFVDDMSLKAFKVGQQVTVFGFEDFECTVVSSQFLPIDVDNYIVTYTVRYTDGDNVYTSNFPSSHCKLKI